LKNYYKIFYLTWILLYLIYPAWALPVSAGNRFLIFSGLLLYFSISAYFLSKLFNNIAVNEPFIKKPEDITQYLKENIWLLILCLATIAFHIYPLISPIFNLGDEAIHLQGGLWVYDFLGKSWHTSLKIIIIGLIIIFLILNMKKHLKETLLRKKENISPKLSFLILICFLYLYFFLLRNIHYDLMLVRYPPVSKFLYLSSYLIFGLTHIGPRIVQLSLYLASALYIYRTINLFFDKKTSLSGAAFYLFLPLSFHFAHTAEIATGLIFFVIIISFYFLRYLKNGDQRDLILTTFLIGIGFLYKRDILLMFFICTAYLTLYSLLKKQQILMKEIKILSISLIPIVPWMIIGKFFNWRNYNIFLPNLTSIDTLTIYLRLLNIEVSWIVFILFILSIIIILIFRRNNLVLFYGFLSLTFYFFYTADYTAKYNVHRFSLIFYPLISISLAQFIYETTRIIKWRYFLGFSSLILSFYLIILCHDSSLREQIMGKRVLKFPSEIAMKWVDDNLKAGEKILILRILPARFYIDKYVISKDKIILLWYEVLEVNNKDKLKRFCIENKITHIMFPYSVRYPFSLNFKEVFLYLKENKNREFIEVAKFKMDENYIYIYKTRYLKNKENNSISER
jgi:hypothetical protein